MTIDEKTALLTVIRALTNQIQYAVDDGKLSPAILEGDLWADTPDKKFSINVEVDWEETPINIMATAFHLEPHPDGIHVQESMTKPEIPFLDLIKEENTSD